MEEICKKLADTNLEMCNALFDYDGENLKIHHSNIFSQEQKDLLNDLFKYYKTINCMERTKDFNMRSTSFYLVFTRCNKNKVWVCFHSERGSFGKWDGKIRGYNS